LHPLIELSNDREVRQAKGFKDAAAALTGEQLAGLYETEVVNAPRRTEVGKKYLVKGKLPTTRRADKDEEHLSLALLKHCRDSGKGLDWVMRIRTRVSARSICSVSVRRTDWWW
jgi:hypothetical protein